jgi:hypothetical protein
MLLRGNSCAQKLIRAGRGNWLWGLTRCGQKPWRKQQ